MKFIIRNQANIPNKYIRFSQWKIRRLSRKFAHVLYSEIYVKKLGANPDVFETIVKLGVPGPDIIIKQKSTNLNEMWSELSRKIKRQLRKQSDKQK